VAMGEFGMWGLSPDSGLWEDGQVLPLILTGGLKWGPSAVQMDLLKHALLAKP
jgi:hypothetical protein